MNKILIIEYDLFFKKTFSGMLTSCGYHVDSVTNSAEGLELVASNDYGLVILDLLDGTQMISQIKTAKPTVDIIVVTAIANLESAVFALKNGARDYFVKPVNPEEFVNSVAISFQQRQILKKNEELMNMVGLFQASQAIVGCLEVPKIYQLMLEAVAREVGVERYLCFFHENDILGLKNSAGISAEGLEHFHDKILSIIPTTLPAIHHIENHKFESAFEGINEACFIYVCFKEVFHGLIVLFNDPDKTLPDIELKNKNIIFLLDHSAQAIDNAETYARTKEMLFIDDVSGLFNYRYFDIAMSRELKRLERKPSNLAILFIDLDNFKNVNDTHGHLVGTAVLREVGALMAKSVREIDIVIRYGGDEFTILLVDTDSEAAKSVAERIRKVVESHSFMALDSYNIKLTCSIGLSCYPDDTTSQKELLEMADKAMYVAKSSGKNSVTRFSPQS